ncbi:MAG: ABC transporter permease [Armatimonadota bacterium]|nr:ABC transporter permease [Armatimonadota bacterium]
MHQAPDLVAGLAMLGVIAALASFPSAVAPLDPMRIGGSPLLPPSGGHPLGTDELGRDLWANLAHGARTSLLVGVLAALLAATIGLGAGAAAGLLGRWWDEGLMRLAELFQIIPRMLIALLLVTLFGSTRWTLISVIAVTGWPMIARVARSEILSLRQREFTLAARALGAGEVHLLWRHLLPGAFPAVLIGLPLQVGRAILLEAGLGFLGLGDPAVASWGRLLQGAQGYMRHAWWLAVFPGLVLTVTILALHLIAEGLHILMTPSLARAAAVGDEDGLPYRGPGGKVGAGESRV